MLHNGRIVLVTGGATGIGHAAALAFAREGGKVAVADIAVEQGEATAAEICRLGGEAIFVPANMLEPDSIREMVQTTVKHFGGLDVAFNNAGHRGGGSNAVDCDIAEWDKVINLNMRAVWLCMKYEIPEMLKRGGGSIVNTASGMSNFAGPNFLTYAASKAGVLGLTRSAAVDFGPSGIRVNALMPGATDTQMLRETLQSSTAQSSASWERIPLRRVSSPEEQAEVAIWLASARASFITGEGVVADGGVTALR